MLELVQVEGVHVLGCELFKFCVDVHIVYCESFEDMHQKVFGLELGRLLPGVRLEQAFNIDKMDLFGGRIRFQSFPDAFNR